MPDGNSPGSNRPEMRPAPPAAGAASAKSGWIGWTVLAILVLAAGAGGTWWWFKDHAPPQAQTQSPLSVPVMTVVQRTVPIYRTYPAATEAVQTVAIQARATGYLLKQDAPDGSDVAAGALLYQIDPRDYQVALAQAQGQLDQSAASLRYSRVSRGRNQVLARNGWTSQGQSDLATSTFQQGEATVATNTAAMQAAALNLSRTEIRAPFAGRISRSMVFEGSLISVAGVTLNTPVQIDPILVSFNPAETNLGLINHVLSQGPIETTVVVSGSPDHTGPLTFIDNQVDRTTGPSSCAPPLPTLTMLCCRVST